MLPELRASDMANAYCLLRSGFFSSIIPQKPSGPKPLCGLVDLIASSITSGLNKASSKFFGLLSGKFPPKGKGPVGSLEFLALLGDSYADFVWIVDVFSLLCDKGSYHQISGSDFKGLLSHAIKSGQVSTIDAPWRACKFSLERASSFSPDSKGSFGVLYSGEYKCWMIFCGTISYL
jgi:hypothetical protein